MDYIGNTKNLIAMQIYYQPHQSRQKEADFVAFLVKSLGIKEVVKYNYPMPDMPHSVNILPILKAINNHPIINGRWLSLVDELKNLPPIVNVFLKSSQISCDAVIIGNNGPVFIEYHEKQHSKLSDNRNKFIYDLAGNRVIVPRFVQRFLRDIWRIQYLHPLIIVWDDKFYRDSLTLQLFDNSTTFEYALDEKKYFSKFINTH